MDTPDLSLGWWTLTDEQFNAALAILAGILGVVVLNALARRASRVVIGMAVSGLVVAACWWAARSGHMPDLPLR
jgi:hypothetical protein